MVQNKVWVKNRAQFVPEEYSSRITVIHHKTGDKIAKWSKDDNKFIITKDFLAWTQKLRGGCYVSRCQVSLDAITPAERILELRRMELASQRWQAPPRDYAGRFLCCFDDPVDAVMFKMEWLD